MDTQTIIQLSGVASVLATGASLVVLARLLYSLETDWGPMLTVLRYTGYVLVASGLLGACLFVAGVPGIVGWLIVMAIWMRAAWNIRLVQRHNLFAALTLAVERQMPLAPMAAAFAVEQEGAFSARARLLAAALERGASLGDALEYAKRTLPPEAGLAAQVGQRTGDLRGALRAITAGRLDRPFLQTALGRIWYGLGLTLLLILILTFMQLKIVPAFVKIFEDFDTELPAATIVLIGVSNAFAPLAVLLPLALVAFVVYLWLQWRGTLKPRLPGFRKLVNWVDMAPVLRSLSLGVQAQTPLEGILRAVASAHPKRSVRERVRRVADDLDNGATWYESLRKRKLIGANDAALLASASRIGNLGWALKEMADSFERRALFRLQLLAQTVLPLTILPLGIIVGFTVVACFLPLVRLITDLS